VGSRGASPGEGFKGARRNFENDIDFQENIGLSWNALEGWASREENFQK
jgi:hypothetical protein